MSVRKTQFKEKPAYGYSNRAQKKKTNLPFISGGIMPMWGLEDCSQRLVSQVELCQ